MLFPGSSLLPSAAWRCERGDRTFQGRGAEASDGGEPTCRMVIS